MPLSPARCVYMPHAIDCMARRPTAPRVALPASSHAQEALEVPAPSDGGDQVQAGLGKRDWEKESGDSGGDGGGGGGGCGGDGSGDGRSSGGVVGDGGGDGDGEEKEGGARR